MLHFRYLTVHWIYHCALQLLLTTALRHLRIKKPFWLAKEKNCQEIVRLYICFVKFSFTFLKKMQKKLLFQWTGLYMIGTSFPENYLPSNLETLFLRFQSYSYKRQVNNLNMFSINNEESWAKAVNGFKPFGKFYRSI